MSTLISNQTKLKLHILLICIWGWTCCWAQKQDKVPAETVVLHLNTRFFLTGETVYFKIYCLDQSLGGKLSKLSSIAYIELIAENGQPLIQRKIKLTNGEGDGDIFLTSDLPSGNYTVLAYTKWMRNFDLNSLFRGTISVINPVVPPPVAKGATPSLKASLEDDMAEKKLKVGLDKLSFGTREKVSVKLGNETDQIMFLSANVRLMEEALHVSSNFSFLSNEAGASGPHKIRYLPDMGCELMSGMVTDKATGSPARGQLITLSSPSQNFTFLVSTTDSTGRYYFKTKDIQTEFVLLHPANGNALSLLITPDGEYLGEYSRFIPPRLELDTSMIKFIKRRHISTQIENAFYEAKKDSVFSVNPLEKFYGKPTRVYNLDDFTRFPTMDDVFRELILEVVVRNRDGNFSLIMKNSLSSYRFQNPPLVLIDGLPIDDANEFMKYDPALIKSISLVARHYYYGAIETDGIISVETFDGVGKNVATENMVRCKFTQPEPQKLYYFPDYHSGRALKRIPDFRTQLYWNPGVMIKASESNTITFFTGDVPGKYFIEIAGVNSIGEKMFYTKEFVVEEKN